MNTLVSKREKSELDNVERLTQRIESYLHQHSYKSAQFLANKLVTLSKNSDEAVFLLAKCYFGSKQYHRAYHLLQNLIERLQLKGQGGKANISHVEIRCRHLGAKCMEECAQWEQVLQILEEKDEDFDILLGGLDNEQFVLASNLCLIRAKAYDMLENNQKGILFYRKALQYDSCCYEAFEKLTIDDHLLTKEEQKQILQNHFGENIMVQNVSQRTKESNVQYRTKSNKNVINFDEFPWIKSLYQAFVMRKVNISEFERYGLLQNSDVQFCLALQHYQSHSYVLSYEILREIIQKDPFDQLSLPLYLTVLVQMEYSTELFNLAHKMVESNPLSALSWYAVGCYYFCIKKYDSARKYFLKSTSIDPRFLHAHFGIAHSYSLSDESDQAISAYRTIYRQYKGCYLAPLYIAMEYIKTNQLQMVEILLTKSQQLADETDPLIYNELGCFYYKLKRYDEALKTLLHAKLLFERLPKNGDPKEWECIMTNLGHTYRRMRQYNKATEYYEQALKMNPKQQSIYSCIGFTYHLQGNLHQAVEYYHKALGFIEIQQHQSDDQLTAGLLSKALEQMSDKPLQYLIPSNSISTTTQQ